MPAEQVRRWRLRVERVHYSDWHEDTTVVGDGPVLRYGDGPEPVLSVSDAERVIAEVRAETRGHDPAFAVLDKVADALDLRDEG